jgi:hypothetical protein
LARAVGSLGEDPRTKPAELLPALDHPGYVAEQAAIILHRMTATPWSRSGSPITSREFWERRLEPVTDRLFSLVPAADRGPAVEILVSDTQARGSKERREAR